MKRRFLMAIAEGLVMTATFYSITWMVDNAGWIDLLP